MVAGAQGFALSWPIFLVMNAVGRMKRGLMSSHVLGSTPAAQSRFRRKLEIFGAWSAVRDVRGRAHTGAGCQTRSSPSMAGDWRMIFWTVGVVVEHSISRPGGRLS